MEAISDKKILFHLDRLAGAKTPVTADIFLTTRCNNKCPFCTYGRWDIERGAEMSSRDFMRYAIRLIQLGVQGFILTGGGEPTVAQDFIPICRWLEDNRLHYGINTNFNRYAEVAPDYLKISFDAWDDESYRRIRGVPAYHKVRENIERYLHWKKRTGAQTAVGIQKVVEAPDEIEAFYSANRDLAVDYIVYRPIESTCGTYYEADGKAQEAADAVRRITELQRADPRVKLNYKWNMLHAKNDGCPAQWAQIALNEKGEVIYCCQKPFEIVGHVMDPDILRKKAEYRTDVSKCDAPCRLTAANRTVAEINNIKEANFL